MSRDLRSDARSLVEEALYGVDKIEDFEEFREKVMDGVAQAAEDACTYHSDCAEIISRWENETEAGDADDLVTARTFRATEHAEALEAWAAAVAHAVLSALTGAALDELSEALDALVEIAEEQTGETLLTSEVRLSAECPHGWAAHDREDAHGTHFWVSRQLDGCNAVALECNEAWVSYTWTPKAGA